MNIIRLNDAPNTMSLLRGDYMEVSGDSQEGWIQL